MATTGTTPTGDLRVSDTERSAVADALGRHYADGRLDRDELDERLDRAMAARTRSELAGVLVGLPAATAPTGVTVAALHRAGPPVLRPRGRRHPVLAVILVLVLLSGLGQVLAHLHLSWLLVALVVVLVVRAVRRR